MSERLLIPAIESKALTPLRSSLPARHGILQRQCACGGMPKSRGECGECRRKRRSTQLEDRNSVMERKHDFPVPDIVREVVRSPGQPLDSQTRADVETHFGYDLSQVRVHTDPRAVESARSVDALAYTAGQNIVFGNGQYAPSSAEGQELLFHELVHVLQQSASASELPQGATIGSPNSNLEQEANSAAREMVRGKAPALTHRAPAGMQMQRQPGSGGKALVLALPRQRLKALGNVDINEIIDNLPAQLFNGQRAVIKQVTIGNVQHVFELTITIQPGAPPVSASALATTSDLTSPSPAAATGGMVKHPILLVLFEKIPNPEMVLFHELLHVRLIVDKYLPSDQQSQTYSKFAQRVEMASDPALLAVTGTAPKRQAVFNGFQMLRKWYTAFVPSFQLPPRLDASGDEERYRDLINEFFANKEAQRAFKKPEANANLARRYQGKLQRDLQIAAQDQNLFATVLQARARAKESSSLQSDLDLADTLGVALTALFDSLEQQLQEIKKFEQSPPAPPPPKTSDPYPPPLKLAGEPDLGNDDSFGVPS